MRAALRGFGDNSRIETENLVEPLLDLVPGRVSYGFLKLDFAQRPNYSAALAADPWLDCGCRRSPPLWLPWVESALGVVV